MVVPKTVNYHGITRKFCFLKHLTVMWYYTDKTALETDSILGGIFSINKIQFLKTQFLIFISSKATL